VPLIGQIGQVQPIHKLGGTGQTGASAVRLAWSSQSTEQKNVRAIWAKMIRPGLQDGLYHFPHLANTNNTSHRCASQTSNMQLNYYNKGSTHIKHTHKCSQVHKDKVIDYYKALLNSQLAPVRPVQGTSQTGATQTATQNISP
jgi:hypothetical protein